MLGWVGEVAENSVEDALERVGAHDTRCEGADFPQQPFEGFYMERVVSVCDVDEGGGLATPGEDGDPEPVPHVVEHLAGLASHLPRVRGEGAEVTAPRPLKEGVVGKGGVACSRNGWFGPVELRSRGGV